MSGAAFPLLLTFIREVRLFILNTIWTKLGLTNKASDFLRKMRPKLLKVNAIFCARLITQIMKVTNLSCDVVFNKDDDLSRRFLARKLLKKKRT